MTYFIKLDYPSFPHLLSDLSKLLDENKISWSNNQICLNTTPDQPNNYHLGVGSLKLDWKNVKTNSNNLSQILTVTPRVTSLGEKDFIYLCDVFKGTGFEEVYNFLSTKYILGRVRIMKIDPKQCMSWHHDYDKRVHYVLATNPGAHLVVEEEVKFLELDSWYLVDTTKKHTAFNGSMHSRIHLVAAVRE